AMTHTTDPAFEAEGSEEQETRGRRRRAKGTDHTKPEHSKAERVTDAEHSKAATVKRGKGVHRRKFLGGMAGVGLGAVGAAGATFALLTDASGNKAGAATNTATLSVPDLLEGTTSDSTTTFTLEAQTGSAEVLSGVTSTTAGYNQSFLGPTMKWTKGNVNVLNITNSLGEDTTVHFHGAHVPAKMDGGPQVAFADGETWSPTFTVKDEPMTLWYHPHALGTTAKQAVHGLAGMIVRTLKALDITTALVGRVPRTGIHGPADLDRLMSRADWVISAAPLTEQTYGMFDEHRFGVMQPSACFINVGRGQLVDEEALVRALTRRWISAAALDVFATEPLPADSPLWDVPGLIVSPHMSGDTVGWRDELGSQFVELYERWAAGRSLLNVVDKQRGYVPGH
ncbi:NAD(P)-dependent oxidoreductase, partial [Streptomyces sp. NPDC005921]